jgi:hypothetical protein
LQGEHLSLVCLVVVAAQVEHAVHDRLLEVSGVLGAYHDVAELAWSRGGAAAVDREREHVSGPLDPAVVGVEAADAGGVGERDRQVPVGDARGAESRASSAGTVALRERQLATPGLDLDLDSLADPGGPTAYAPRRADRISGAWRCA